MKKIKYLFIALCFLILFRTEFYVNAEEKITNIKLNKKITGTIDSVIYENAYKFKIDTKQKIQLSFECLSNNKEPENISLYISNIDNDYSELFESKNFIASYGVKTLQNFTLKKGTYILYIGNGEGVLDNENTYKYKFSINTTTNEASKISIDSKATIRVGSPYQFQAMCDNQVITNYGLITWQSSDTSIASIDKYGKVKAKKKGTCKITATLSNGKKSICDITVPTPTIYDQIRAQSIFAQYNYVMDKSIYNDCYVKVYNNSKKNIVYMELNILQYDSRGYILKSPYSLFTDDDTLKPSETTEGSWWVNDSAKKARVCIKKVWFEDGTTWTNPLYNTWLKTYQNKNY